MKKSTIEVKDHRLSIVPRDETFRRSVWDTLTEWIVLGYLPELQEISVRDINDPAFRALIQMDMQSLGMCV